MWLGIRGRRSPVPARHLDRVHRALALTGALCAVFLSGSAFAGKPDETLSASGLKAALAAHEPTNLDGTKLEVTDLRDQVVVVNFWATWCKPCHRELPRLDALHEEIASRGGRVVAISVDRDLENVRRFLVENDLDLPVYHDGPEGVARALQLRYLPYTVVLNRKGEIAYTAAGADDHLIAGIERTARELVGITAIAAASPERDTP